MRTTEQETIRPSNRRSLEDFWRRELCAAQAKYDVARMNYRRALEEQNDRPVESDSALASARQAEARALAEYTRVLRVFTELTVHGRIPPEPAER